MKLFVQNYRNYARHLFLWVLCFSLLGSLFSCGNEGNRIDPSQPLAIDDASLLKWQMEKFIRTRAASYTLAFVTTKSNLDFKVTFANEDYTVDWGDGTVESNATSHTYTDGLPAHTVFVYANSSALHLDVSRNEIIYLDVSRSRDLKGLLASNNRLTNIDLTNNQELTGIGLAYNNLHSIDLSVNTKVIDLNIKDNPLEAIDIRTLLSLVSCDVSNTALTSLDVSHNNLLRILYLARTNIQYLDVTHNPDLIQIIFNETLIEEIDVSKNPILDEIDAISSNLKTLDVSNNPVINVIMLYDSKIESLVVSPENMHLDLITIFNTPLDQNVLSLFRLVTNLPNRNLPDSRTGKITSGGLYTDSPHRNDIQTALKELNWELYEGV